MKFYRLIGRLLIIIGSGLSPLYAVASEWGVGFAVAHHQPPQKDVDHQIGAAPAAFYEGERLTVGLGQIAYRLIKSESTHLALEGQVRYHGYDSESSDALSGMQQRDPALEIGLSINRKSLFGRTQLRVMGDLSDTHGGYELNINQQVSITKGRWSLLSTLGLSRQSRQITNYYYGVRKAEALPTRAAYHPDAAINTMAGTILRYKLTRRWMVLGGVEYVRLDTPITDSPIIDKHYLLTSFSGLLYRF